MFTATSSSNVESLNVCQSSEQSGQSLTHSNVPDKTSTNVESSTANMCLVVADAPSSGTTVDQQQQNDLDNIMKEQSWTDDLQFVIGDVELETNLLECNERANDSVSQEEHHWKDTKHTQPDWLDNLKRNFYEEIISKCSEFTRNCVDNNIKIQV